MGTEWGWPQWWFAISYFIAFFMHIIVLVGHEAVKQRLSSAFAMIMLTIGMYALQVAGFW